MDIPEIIELSGKIRGVDEKMDPVTAIIFVLRFKYEKELTEKTVPLFESITQEMELPVKKYRNWTHYSQLRESFNQYVQTHISSSKMAMILAILHPAAD